MEPSWYEKLLDLARAIFTLRHGVISAVTIIVVSSLAAIVIATWLNPAPLFAFMLCFVFLVGITAVVLIALKAPELTALGGPDLPDPLQMQRVRQLFEAKRAQKSISIESTRIQNDPTQVPPPKIELSEEEPEKKD